MMENNILKFNKEMLASIKSFNILDEAKAEIIFSRILLSPFIDVLYLFNENEKDSLIQFLEIETVGQLLKIIRAFQYVFMWAVAERNINSAKDGLVEAGLKEELITVFENCWVNYSSEYANQIREKITAINGELQNFQWNIQLPIEQNILEIQDIHKFTKEQTKDKNILYSIDSKNPIVQMKFEIKNNAVDVSNFQLSFTKTDIQELFETFEKIQNKIDQIL